MNIAENQTKRPARAQYLESAAAAAKAQERDDWNAALNEWEAALEFVQDIPGAWRGKAIALERLGHLDQAGNAFADGLRRWPDDPALLFGKARIEEKRANWKAALADWQTAQSRAPERIEACLGIGRSLSALGRDEEAQTVLEAATGSWPDDERLLLLLGQVLRQTEGPDKVIAYWRNLAGKLPQRGDIAFLLADVLHQSGQDKAALAEALRAAKECHAPNAPHLLERAAELALRLAGSLHPPEECLKIAAGLASRFPGNAQINAAIARQHFVEGDMTAVIRGLTATIARTPDDWNAYIGLGEALQQVAATDPEARQVVETRLAAEIARNGGEMGARFAAYMQDTAAQLRPLLKPGPGEILETAGSGTAVIFFGGMAVKQPRTMPFLLDRFFASRGIKALYVTDHSGNLGLHGIASAGDSMDSTAAYLRERIRAHPRRRICMIGSSGGGLAAVHYGLRLGADQIIGLSAATNLTSDFFTQNRDRRARLTIRRLNQTIAQNLLDVRPWLASAAKRPQIDLFFAAENEGDWSQAKHISGLPEVRLHATSGWQNHNIMPALFKSGLFAAELDRLLSGE